MFRILSLGAGVQSTVLLLKSLRGELPKLDCAIFADTHAEPMPVYAHLEWLRRKCEAAGMPMYIVSAGDLRTDTLAGRRDANVKPTTGRKGFATVPLFVRNDDGSVGRVKRQCTSEYKIVPIENFIRREILGLSPRQRAPKKAVVDHWFGITSDERRRAKPPGGNRSRDAAGRLVATPTWWKIHVYPLIDLATFWIPGAQSEMFGKPSPIPTSRSLSGIRPEYPGMEWSRANCIDWLADNYPDRTFTRSACTFCPYRSNADWAEMRENDPESFSDACRVDEALRKNSELRPGCLSGVPFVHRSMRPLREVNFELAANDRGIPEQDATGELMGVNASETECEGMCGL